MANPLIERVRVWLFEKAFPLWLEAGVDSKSGGFFECLSMAGDPLLEPKRTMVQARQIFCCRLAMELSDGMHKRARSAADAGIDFFLRHCSGSKGEFVHAVTVEGREHNKNPDLYAQGFALLGLAQAYFIRLDPNLKDRAKRLIDYLEADRRLPGGGFSELHDGKVKYEANPHMHLFEAALAWMEIDGDPRWRWLADQVLEVCLTRFVDKENGFLCEHFGENWRREARFVFEPGHHYEWAWLFGRYEQFTGEDLGKVSRRLFETAEAHGVDRDTGTVLDEIWSDLKPKSRTSRFWPQCERIKAALQIGNKDESRTAACAASADEAMQALFQFLDTPRAGLWFDTKHESGEFKVQPAKASSFYHIAGAMSEYLRQRQELDLISKMAAT